MSSKRLPSDISVDELLSGLESEDTTNPTPEEEHTSDVLAFIRFYKLQPGDHPVRSSVLHKLYVLFSKDPLADMPFIKEFRNYFNDNDSKPLRFFINRSAFDIRDVVLKEINKHKRPKVKSKDFRKHFERFLKEMNVKPGGFYLSPFDMFCIYDEWAFKQKKRKPIAFAQFVQLLRFYFPKKQLEAKPGYPWYGINRDIIKDYLTDDKITRIKEWSKAYAAKTKKKETKPS